MAGSETVDEVFELWCIERNDFATLCAVKMVMVWLERSGELVGFLPASVNDFDNAKRNEKLQCAIDACPVDFLASRDELTDG